MKVRIQMVFEAEDGRPEVIEEVAQLQRGPLRSSELGLSLTESEHLLDWFHITMRLTVMGQLVKGMKSELKPDERYAQTPTVLASLDKHLESVKWNPVSYTHLRAHETVLDIVCRLLLE